MRKCLTISLILVAAMMVGCQTQSWRDTNYAPGAGRDADTPWQVHGGLFELGASFSGGVSQVKDLAVDETVSDVDVMRLRGAINAGYMLNDYWQVGAFVEFGSETWKFDDKSIGDADATSWAIGPKIIYNFSNVGTDVVPYCSLAGGWGAIDVEPDDGDSIDGDRAFGQAAFGFRFFAWDGVAWGVEAYYRYVEDRLDDSDDTVVRSPWEAGVALTLSVFF